MPDPERAPSAERVVKAVEEVGKKAALEAEKVGVRQLRRWQWKAAGVGVAVMAGFAFVFLHSCSALISIPTLPGPVSGVQELPPALRSAASCDRPDPAGAVDKCVIAAGQPLLAGGVAGERELDCYLQVESPDQVKATIRRWRAAGAKVLSDGSVFVAIGPSDNVWYADTRSGLELETGTFAGAAAARTFVTRAGLV
ncbi:MAG: hypothetical protein JWN03_6243 [Nocardia sp.]|uniref:hypothetical protein n=1 Tax=Nocardia sp. TaxID=1821 RepID=UPI00261662E9|nr:hypothetical protein [Nocardia sp.]MCU1645968.1 hypothetical protein [Nocardia sp.]